MHRCRLRWRIVSWAVALAAAAALAWGVPTALGRTRPPVAERLGSERAFSEARERDAARYAPDELADAERALREARRADRRQQLRPYPLRNFGPVRAMLLDAEASARHAARVAEERRHRDDEATARTIALAACRVRRTGGLIGSFRYDDEAARLMQQARLRAHEAENRFERGERARARTVAEEAMHLETKARERIGVAIGRFVDGEQVARWRRQREETIAWSSRSRGPAIVVNKEERELTLYVAGRPVASYSVELGLDPMRRKSRAGDTATPEGRYHVRSKRGPGATRYFLALELDYPNAEDRKRIGHGVPPGGLIEIHGEGGRGWDWTRGCISLRNEEMRRLYDRVAQGTPVTIIGGDGDGGRFSTLARRLAGTEADDACRADP